MSASVVTGQCLCGTVRFEVELPPLWCANCHCSLCRRAHSAAFVTWVGVSASAFRVVAGAEHRRAYASTPTAHRTFCDVCGSQLTFQADRWADEIHVPRACLPDDLALSPAAHAFFTDRAPWVEIHDELPRRGGPTGVEPL